MKRLITVLAVLVAVCVATLTADAAVRVRGYYRSNGTYVQPHYRSNPDGNFNNNWSTYPNVNPYTGSIGTRHTPSYSGGYSWRTPSYSIPNYSRGSSLVTPSHNLYGSGSSLSGGSSFSRRSSLWGE